MPHPVIVLPTATVVWHDTGCTTVFPEGRSLLAEPHETDAYEAQAVELGYTADRAGRLAMCRDHETLHSFLAFWLFRAPSPTLQAVARGGSVFREWRREEEDVFTVQRVINDLRRRWADGA